jgi:hypothetical protein
VKQSILEWKPSLPFVESCFLVSKFSACVHKGEVIWLGPGCPGVVNDEVTGSDSLNLYSP